MFRDHRQLSKEDFKNYQPLSRLKFPGSKLVECIAAAQIRSHIDSNDLGKTFQPAYEAGNGNCPAVHSE